MPGMCEICGAEYVKRPISRGLPAPKLNLRQHINWAENRIGQLEQNRQNVPRALNDHLRKMRGF